jgi:hypothetical protein
VLQNNKLAKKGASVVQTSWAIKMEVNKMKINQPRRPGRGRMGAMMEFLLFCAFLFQSSMMDVFGIYWVSCALGGIVVKLMVF